METQDPLRDQPESESDVFAVASLALAIAGVLVLLLFGVTGGRAAILLVLGWLCFPAAIISGAVGLTRRSGRGVAAAGLAIGAIAVLFSILLSGAFPWREVLAGLSQRLPHVVAQ